MSYPGGKNGSGVYQAIINQMPPHEVYIEPFLGGAAIMRNKRPARVNIGLDRDRAAVARIEGHPMVADLAISDDARFTFETRDAIAFLKSYQFTGDELVYCDPPYMHGTRKVLDLYDFEMTDTEHGELLATLRQLPCMVMVSGYHTRFYEERLSDWHNIQFQAMTRSGQQATEWLWMNFAPPVELHDYRFLGSDFRERERIKRKKERWTARLEKMPLLERQAMLAAIREAWPAAAPSKMAMPESDNAEIDDVQIRYR